MTNSTSTAAFSISTQDELDNFAHNFAKHSKLKPTHIKTAIAKTRGYQTIAGYQDNLLQNSTTKTASASTVLEQIEKAQNIINVQETLKDNDLEELKILLPFFSQTCIKDHNYSSADKLTLNAISVCQKAASNYIESEFSSILITHSHYNNDNSGRDHYLNKIVVKHGNDTVEIQCITILERDNCAWELTREQPITANLNGENLDDLFFDNFDNFAKLICNDSGQEFYWDNPVEPTLLRKAQAVITKNQAAMALFVAIEDF